MARKIYGIILTLLILLSTLQVGSVDSYAADLTVDEWMGSLDRVADQMAEEHFFYSNDRTKSTLAAAKNSRRASNCAKYVSWALQDAGILKKGQTFWLQGNKIKGNTKAITNNKRLQVLRPNKKASKAGLQKGDICSWKNRTHTAVYAGKDSKGNLLWYSAGKDGATKKDGKYYFTAKKVKAMKRASRYDGTIAVIVRIRNLDETPEPEVEATATEEAVTANLPKDEEQDVLLNDMTDPSGEVGESDEIVVSESVNESPEEPDDYSGDIPGDAEMVDSGDAIESTAETVEGDSADEEGMIAMDIETEEVWDKSERLTDELSDDEVTGSTQEEEKDNESEFADEVYVQKQNDSMNSEGADWTKGDDAREEMEEKSLSDIPDTGDSGWHWHLVLLIGSMMGIRMMRRGRA